MPGILEETLTLMRSYFKERFNEITIEKLNVGVFMTLVKLSTGYCGISITDVDTRAGSIQPSDRYSGPFSPGKVQGQKIADLFNHAGGNKLTEIIRLSVMNAISAEIIAQADYKIVENTDPVDLLDLGGSKKVVIVGAFQSYIRRFDGSNHRLTVLELNKKALAPEQYRYFAPASKAKVAMKNADIIVITGSTLANNTLDELLTFTPPAAAVIVVGPSSGIIPDVLFRKGVDIIGATRILDYEKARILISEGGTGYHLFGNCAQKICLVQKQATPSSRVRQ